MALDFVADVALPAISQVSEKRLWGKRFIRFGPLLMTVGPWVFQQGGALGYALRDHPSLLDKIVFGDVPRVGIEALSEEAQKVIVSSNGDRSGFLNFYTLPRFNMFGLDPLNFRSPSKELKKKIPSEAVESEVLGSWIRGAAVGFHAPEIFREVWENAYEPVPTQKWEEMKAAGLGLSERQEDLQLDDVVRGLALGALEWSETSPDLLDPEERAVLFRMVGQQ
jgi:hypothetical protein